MEYPLINIEGVFLFLNNDSYYLIDTGSPFTYTKFGSILINEKEYKNTLFKSILEDRCNKLSSRLKKNVCGIIGLDVISSEGLFIDKKNNKLSFCSKDLEGIVFKYDYINNNILKYIILNLMVSGLQDYGEKKFLFDTGIASSLFTKELCIHSQYAYRKELYYLALDNKFELDYVFNSISQNFNSIQLEVAGFDDATFKQQIEPLGVSGLISFNDLVKEYLIINKDKNTIIIK